MEGIAYKFVKWDVTMIRQRTMDQKEKDKTLLRYYPGDRLKVIAGECNICHYDRVHRGTRVCAFCGNAVKYSL
jgi:hypothetical protein